jgi:hypothetical protein
MDTATQLQCIQYMGESMEAWVAAKLAPEQYPGSQLIECA